MTLKKKLSIMGVGAYCLDTIVKREYPEGFVPGKRNKFVEHLVSEEIGSNPGNVMCIMGWFGWNSQPIALFDDSPEGLKLTADFKRYGCNTRYVTNTPDGGTNMLRITHGLDDEGHPKRRFSKRHAPGSGFPRDKAFTVMGSGATLPKFIESIDELPDVYFYESTTPAWRELGRWMRSQGVLVYYEVQRLYSKEFPKYLKCMKESDIVKFSDDTVPDVTFLDELRDKLVIQTLGAKGVRFNLRGEGWVTLPPVVNPDAIDSEGCGDWTTASFINALGKRGKVKAADLTTDLVSECLMEAQGYASRCAGFMGSKGVINAEKQ